MDSIKKILTYRIILIVTVYIIDYVRYMSELRLVAGLFNPQGGIFRHGFT